MKSPAPPAVAKKITTSGVIVARLGQASPPSSAGERTLRLVALGDSLTAGFGLPPGEAFPDRLQAALRAKGFDVEVVNAGVGGNTATDELARYTWSVPADADALIVELGTNDMLRRVKPEATGEALTAILEKAKAANLPVLLTGVRAAPNLGPEYDRAFDAIFPKLAAAYGAALYPVFLEGVEGDPTLNQPDGLHPNAEGVNAIVGRILPAVEGLLNKASPLHNVDNEHAAQTVQYSGGPPNTTNLAAGACVNISGLWSWFVNGDVTFNSDRTLVQGALTGEWVCTDGHVVIHWSHNYVDNLSLSSEGTHLQGTNNVNSQVSGNKYNSGTPPTNASSRFVNPMYNGYRLDWCRIFETECGAPAAEAFCKAQGFIGVGAFKFQPNPGVATMTIGQNSVCDPQWHGCDSFEFVRCR